MAGTWRKAKIALGLNHCMFMEDDASPSEDDASPSTDVADHISYANLSSVSSDCQTSASSDPAFSTTATKASKDICSICLGTMKSGDGHALFTAECSHMFHFHCIASNVKHGNYVCPICRAKWNEVPLQGLGSSNLPNERPVRVNSLNLSQVDDYTTIVRHLPRSVSVNRQQHLRSVFNISEPSSYNDDEPLAPQSNLGFENENNRTVEIKTYPEFSSILNSASQDNFTVLIHLKASMSSSRNPLNMPISETSSAPLDLVTVLDVSGSMLGTKLALLKRAMCFVIQNLGPADRLSVVVFSSTARRLFPLHSMSESGRQEALQAINSLVCGGGTNIAEGLRKGAKVIEERREKNPVCSIILLSDGQDTYMLPSDSDGPQHSQAYYKSLLPPSIQAGGGHNVPVHAFGFGSDHDSVLMHSISEISGGTYSFIETESVIQDAFAQCIGGLMSVVVQELHVDIECVYPDVCICSIKCGSYAKNVADDKMSGSVNIGDLYADEERDFLVSIDVPSAPEPCEEIVLLKVGCIYMDPVSKESVNLEQVDVKIQRPDEVSMEPLLSVEVDRQRNRLLAAEAMTEARAAAERGELSEAVIILEKCQQSQAESLSGRSGDRLCVTLDAELREMQGRMTSQAKYKKLGRAYVLSGLSSHSSQRATTRGNSTVGRSRVQSYQTPSMTNMIERSLIMNPGTQQTTPSIRSCRSLPKTR